MSHFLATSPALIELSSNCVGPALKGQDLISSNDSNEGFLTQGQARTLLLLWEVSVCGVGATEKLALRGGVSLGRKERRREEEMVSGSYLEQ